MFDAFRQRMGYRALDAAVASRTAATLSPRLSDRSALVVLPAAEDEQRAAWAFIEALDIPRSQLTVVVVSERVAYAPDRFAGAVKRIPDAALDWRGVPRADAVADLGRAADVAVDLSEAGGLAARYLVGTSSSPVRIGRHEAGAERYYDLMLAGATTTSELVAGLRRALDRLDPPILPLH